MDFKVIHINETDSTNRWLAEHRTDELLAIVADYQTAGKGCGANTWESERGKNLTFSMLIHPTEIHASRQFLISEMVSVALCETLAQYLEPMAAKKSLRIKWPNDIYYGDQKICGILIENLLQGSTIKDSIIGIGLNVNQREFKSDAPNPVSLYQLTGKETDLGELLKAFLAAFDETYNCKTTCFAYREMLYRRQKYATYATKTTCFTARLMDVLPDGRLLLVDKDGQEQLYAFKEIQFII